MAASGALYPGVKEPLAVSETTVAFVRAYKVYAVPLLAACAKLLPLVQLTLSVLYCKVPPSPLLIVQLIVTSSSLGLEAKAALIEGV